MTGLQLAAIAGSLIASGFLLAVRALRPAPPALGAALDRLSVQPSVRGPVPTSSSATRSRLVPHRVLLAAEQRLGVPDTDLAILGMTRADLAARKLRLALLGLLAPSVIGLLMAVAGVPFGAAIPVAAGIGTAAVGWFLPTADVRENARAARQEFRSNLECYLTLVAGERRARGSVEQALEEAARVSGSVPFRRMHQAVRRSALAGRKPWTDLRELGDELGVEELRGLADIAAVASDGASVYNTLLATARSLRHAELADARTQANEVSERMARPLALLVTGLTLFVLVPFLIRMFTTAT